MLMIFKFCPMLDPIGDYGHISIVYLISHYLLQMFFLYRFFKIALMCSLIVTLFSSILVSQRLVSECSWELAYSGLVRGPLSWLAGGCVLQMVRTVSGPCKYPDTAALQRCSNEDTGETCAGARSVQPAHCSIQSGAESGKMWGHSNVDLLLPLLHEHTHCIHKNTKL